MTAAVEVRVPHGGDGTHTLVVAVPIADGCLTDPQRHADIVDRVVIDVVRVLATAVTPRRGGWAASEPSPTSDGPPPAVCEACDAAAMPGGGRWCLRCFHRHVAGRRKPKRRAS